MMSLIKGASGTKTRNISRPVPRSEYDSVCVRCGDAIYQGVLCASC